MLAKFTLLLLLSFYDQLRICLGRGDVTGISISLGISLKSLVTFKPQIPIYLMGEEKKLSPFTENNGSSLIFPHSCYYVTLGSSGGKVFRFQMNDFSSPDPVSGPQILMMGPEDEGIG